MQSGLFAERFVGLFFMEQKLNNPGEVCPGYGVGEAVLMSVDCGMNCLIMKLLATRS